ncbi:hypothetical protein BDV93DRAFT_608395 [Ceratobasidium sp. AG-I]|nr:hypothetical protein BDV93DRAFT_608395 [Ceratobasidium sp. AG-I]
MKLSGILTAASLLHVVYAANGPNWPGFKGLRYFFAFGDSYTSIGFNSWASAPTDANPLGVSYPGSTSADGANWAGYFTMQYNQSKFWTYDYAVYGNTVAGVTNQVTADFLPNAGTKPSYAPWSATNSLFATFIGINDLNSGANIATTLTTLFNLQESLYTAGARNFVFINVPPMNRAPFSNNNTALAANITTWNTQLQTYATAFQAKHSDIATFYYDSWSLYTKLLNNPSTYGFTDVTTSGGSFWIDTIHVRTKVHQYMAADLATFLQNQAASTTNPATTSTATSTISSTTTRTTTSTIAPVTTTTTSSAPASTATGTVPKYGQCGGSGYTGPTTCVSGSTCTYSSQWYSQCV